MPSPFPGMDPYLENRSLWPDFHTSFIAYIREQLQAQIRPKYNARIEERIHLIQPPHNYYPDVSIIRHPLRERVSVPAGEVLVADEPYVINTLESEFREPFIEIVFLSTGDVVTTIEVLNPINKFGEGRDRYLQKQRQMLSTESSLVEIDLLREGSHTAAVPKERLNVIKGWRYIVSIKRAGQNKEFEVYFNALKSRLPRCRIPLRPPDADAVLDLPAVFDRTYNVSGFEDFIDYREPPPSPLLSDEEEAWLDGLLREKGLRDAAD